MTLQAYLQELEAVITAAPEIIQDETPWDLFGAYENDPAWGEFFDELERRRTTDEVTRCKQ